MKELSSPLSFFYKFVFLFLWFVGIGYSLRGTIFSPEALFEPKWIQYVVIWLGVTVFIYFTTGTIKRVAVDGKNLVVSNFLKEERIPLSHISGVDGSTFLSPKLVWITLQEKSAFGKRITFLPKHRMSSGFGKHPIVQELTQELKL